MDWNHSNSSRFLIVQDFPSVLLLFLRQQRPFSGLCLWVHTYSFCWMSRGRITVLKLRYIFNDFSYVLAIIFQWHWAISASVHEAAFSTLLALTWFPSDMKVVCHFRSPHLLAINILLGWNFLCVGCWLVCSNSLYIQNMSSVFYQYWANHFFPHLTLWWFCH